MSIFKLSFFLSALFTLLTGSPEIKSPFIWGWGIRGVKEKVEFVPGVSLPFIYKALPALLNSSSSAFVKKPKRVRGARGMEVI